MAISEDTSYVNFGKKSTASEKIGKKGARERGQRKRKEPRLFLPCFCPRSFLDRTLIKAVFTLGLDYDRVIFELNMKWVNIN